MLVYYRLVSMYVAPGLSFTLLCFLLILHLIFMFVHDVCMCLCGQGVNGTAALYHLREKSNEGVTRGPLKSEKEALLLGKISLVHIGLISGGWIGKNAEWIGLKLTL